jgi:hypothetical protein
MEALPLYDACSFGLIEELRVDPSYMNPCIGSLAHPRRRVQLPSRQ